MYNTTSKFEANWSQGSTEYWASKPVSMTSPDQTPSTDVTVAERVVKAGRELGVLVAANAARTVLQETR